MFPSYASKALINDRKRLLFPELVLPTIPTLSPSSIINLSLLKQMTNQASIL